MGKPAHCTKLPSPALPEWTHGERRTVSAAQRVARPSHMMAMSPEELRIMDSLLHSDAVEPHREASALGPAWSIFGLLDACSSHPQLSKIASDEEVCNLLLAHINADPYGAAVATFVAHVCNVLATEETDQHTALICAQ